MMTKFYATLILAITIYVRVFGQDNFDKGRALYETKKYSEAGKVFNTIPSGSSSYGAAQYYLGRIAFDMKEYEKASEYLEIAIENDNKNSNHFFLLGHAYSEVAKIASIFTKPSWASKARSAYEKSATLDKLNIGPRLSLITYYSVVPGVMGGSMEKAKAMAIEVMKLNEAEGHWQLGNLLLTENNTSGAEAEFEKMRKVNPDYVRHLASYNADQKRYDKAFELFEEALKRNPNDFLTLYRYGKASAMSGLKLDRGEECLIKYLPYSPEYGEPSVAGAYMRLGQINEKKGKKMEARKNYQAALQLDGSLKEAKTGLDRVK